MKITQFLKHKSAKVGLGMTALVAIAIQTSALAISGQRIHGRRQLRRVPGPPVHQQCGRAPRRHRDVAVAPGISNGQTVNYVVTDASDGSVATALGVNRWQSWRTLPTRRVWRR
jgi:hypothetical protein